MTTYIASKEAGSPSAGGYATLKLEVSGYTAGSQTVSLAFGVTNYLYLLTDTGVPGASGNAGLYTAEVNVTTAAGTSGGTIYGSVAVNRVDVSGTVLASSAFTAEQSFGATGVKTFTVTASAIGSFSAGHRIRLDVKCRNSHPTLARTFVWYMGTTNSEVVAPDASTATYVTAGPATIAALGQTASLTVYDSVPSAAATVVLLGQTASVSEASAATPTYVTAGPATINTSGQSATLRQPTLISASAGSVVAVGQSATLRQSTLISASPATINTSGQTATLRQSALIPASPATVLTAGQPATITDAAPATGIACSPATVLTAGQTATLRQTTLVPASSATVLAAGQTATLRQTTLVPASPATVLTAGQTATVVVAGPAITAIECSPATVLAAGQTATINEATGLRGRRVRHYRTYLEPTQELGEMAKPVFIEAPAVPTAPASLAPVAPLPLWAEKPATPKAAPAALKIKRTVGMPATVQSETHVQASIAYIGPQADKLAEALLGAVGALHRAIARLDTADAAELRRVAVKLMPLLSRITPMLDELEAEQEEEEAQLLLLLSRLPR